MKNFTKTRWGRRFLWESDNTVETVVLLSQQKPDDTIEIDLDLDELDVTSVELKATYQEIKDYVLKEFGLKVSSLICSLRWHAQLSAVCMSGNGFRQNKLHRNVQISAGY